MPDGDKDEWATAAHCSPAGLKAAVDRLHTARLAKVRGYWVRDNHRDPAELRPVATDAGRELVATIEAGARGPAGGHPGRPSAQR